MTDDTPTSNRFGGPFQGPPVASGQGLPERAPWRPPLVARSLLNEAQAAVERAQHDDTEQAYCEMAYDCYD